MTSLPDTPRVLHVTESMTTGVAAFIERAASLQAEEGALVSLLYAERTDTADRASIEARLGPGVTVLPPVKSASALGRTVRLALRLMGEDRRSSYSAVHMHSSLAGGAGRLALIFSRTAKFYSPHGFGFLRLDLPSIARRVLLLAEVMLARVGSLILTSPSEIELARHQLHAPRVGYVQSGVSRASIPSARIRQSKALPQVIMVGRVAYQKAPWTFASIARQLADRAEFVWVGAYGESEHLKWVGDAPVRMEPWVTPDELDRMLDESDILLFPTLWEGQSLSLIKALSRGLPAVTTDVVGNRDAVVDGVTGFVCDGEQQLLERVRLLLDDPELRIRMGVAAREHAMKFQVDDALGADLLSEYKRLQ